MFDDPSRLKTLAGIVAEARPAFELLLAEATRRGFQPYIVSALRTCDEQHNLAGTMAKRSWHVLGHAVDIELHARGDEPDMATAYRALGQWWKDQGGTWGGDWEKLYPVPHPAGWCGPEDLAGDPCHFQWTGGREAVPKELWPDGLSCAEVDALQSRYLAAHGVSGPIPSVLASVPIGTPDATPVKPSGARRGVFGFVVATLLTIAMAKLARRRA